MIVFNKSFCHAAVGLVCLHRVNTLSTSTSDVNEACNPESYSKYLSYDHAIQFMVGGIGKVPFNTIDILWKELYQLSKIV